MSHSGMSHHSSSWHVSTGQSRPPSTGETQSADLLLTPPCPQNLPLHAPHSLHS